MQKTNTAVEIRNDAKKLVAKYYPATGWIVIQQKDKETIIKFPAGTPIEITHRDVAFTK